MPSERTIRGGLILREKYHIILIFLSAQSTKQLLILRFQESQLGRNLPTKNLPLTTALGTLQSLVFRF
jgi:hypothetical protein